MSDPQPRNRETPRLFTGEAKLPFDVHAAVSHLTTVDPALGRLMARVGPCRLQLDAGQSPFEALSESIIYQQLSGKAAATIAGRVRALFAPKAFPSPEDILAAADETLRTAGVSRNKILALKDLARHTLGGTVPGLEAIHALGDDELIGRLTQVRGIGQWTVEMLLIFRLGRPDVLPTADLGVRKGFARTYGQPEMPTPKALYAHGERWRPYRTVASWYFWRALELPD